MGGGWLDGIDQAPPEKKARMLLFSSLFFLNSHD